MDDFYDDIIEKFKKLRIVYIEDDHKVAKQLVEYLELFDVKIALANTIQSGFETYEETKPDIIIADINLPDGNGVELVQKIRTIDSKTRIIMLTAHTDKEYLLPTIELGVTRYLIKPIDESRLLEALKKALNELDEARVGTNRVDLGDGVIYDKSSLSLYRDGESTALSSQEAKFLEWLCIAYPSILTYQAIENLQSEPTSQNALRLIVKKLRIKTSKKTIQNISGIGYKLCLQ